MILRFVILGWRKEELIAWLEKQGEQKPNFCHHEVDFSSCSEEYRKAYYDGWNNCNQQHAQLEADMKYIDAEKLKNEIDKQIKKLEPVHLRFEPFVTGQRSAFQDYLNLIDSFQQKLTNDSQHEIH